jgi:hypothetical protein
MQWDNSLRNQQIHINNISFYVVIFAFSLQRQKFKMNITEQIRYTEAWDL